MDESVDTLPNFQPADHVRQQSTLVARAWIERTLGERIGPDPLHRALQCTSRLQRLSKKFGVSSDASHSTSTRRRELLTFRDVLHVPSSAPRGSDEGLSPDRAANPSSSPSLSPLRPAVPRRVICDFVESCRRLGVRQFDDWLTDEYHDDSPTASAGANSYSGGDGTNSDDKLSVRSQREHQREDQAAEGILALAWAVDSTFSSRGSGGGYVRIRRLRACICGLSKLRLMQYAQSAVQKHHDDHAGTSVGNTDTVNGGVDSGSGDSADRGGDGGPAGEANGGGDGYCNATVGRGTLSGASASDWLACIGRNDLVEAHCYSCRVRTNTAGVRYSRRQSQRARKSSRTLGSLLLGTSGFVSWEAEDAAGARQLELKYERASQDHNPGQYRGDGEGDSHSADDDIVGTVHRRFRSGSSAAAFACAARDLDMARWLWLLYQQLKLQRVTADATSPEVAHLPYEPQPLNTFPTFPIFPPSLRGTLWYELSGASRRARRQPRYFRQLVEVDEHESEVDVLRQIDADIPRTLHLFVEDDASTHSSSDTESSSLNEQEHRAAEHLPEGDGENVSAKPTRLQRRRELGAKVTAARRQALRRLLLAFARHCRGIGYCQGISYVAARLLRWLGDEERAFWCMVQLVGEGRGDGLVPDDYYTTMLGVLVDQQVFADLLQRALPLGISHLQELGGTGMELPLMSTEWFLTLYSAPHNPAAAVAAVWDALFLLHSDQVLFAVGLAIMKLGLPDLLQARSHHEALASLQQLLTSRVEPRDSTALLREARAMAQIATPQAVQQLREHHRPLVEAQMSMQTVNVDGAGDGSRGQQDHAGTRGGINRPHAESADDDASGSMQSALAEAWEQARVLTRKGAKKLRKEAKQLRTRYRERRHRQKRGGRNQDDAQSFNSERLGSPSSSDADPLSEPSSPLSSPHSRAQSRSPEPIANFYEGEYELIEEYFGSSSQAPHGKVERSRQQSRERLFASLLEEPERSTWDGVRGAARTEHASALTAPAGNGTASVGTVHTNVDADDEGSERVSEAPPPPRVQSTPRGRRSSSLGIEDICGSHSSPRISRSSSDVSGHPPPYYADPLRANGGGDGGGGNKEQLRRQALSYYKRQLSDLALGKSAVSDNDAAKRPGISRSLTDDTVPTGKDFANFDTVRSTSWDAKFAAFHGPAPGPGQAHKFYGPPADPSDAERDTNGVTDSSPAGNKDSDSDADADSSNTGVRTHFEALNVETSEIF